jgi:hypothetical protein
MELHRRQGEKAGRIQAQYFARQIQPPTQNLPAESFVAFATSHTGCHVLFITASIQSNKISK